MASNITDIPLLASDNNSDKLKIQNYIEALSTFISNSETPMTIAVQGEWGCGKTSLMNAIAGRVCVNYYQLGSRDIGDVAPENVNDQQYLGVWINTWQYSVLKNDSDAQISIIKGVARELSAHMNRLMGASSIVKEAGRKLLSSIGGIALTAAKVGVGVAGVDPASLSGLDEMIRTQENGPDYFREKLSESIKEYLQEFNEKRRSKKNPVKGVIFFIDDLDRLDPPVAVQVLSLLKNLFEVPKCIFVLAIDYEVVVEGLVSRFGQRTDKNEREFRSFFDKIIQLSFRVPIETYQIDGLLKELLQGIGYCKSSYTRKDLLDDKYPEFLSTLVNLTVNSCGKNPRSIKRMLNTLSLVREIHRGGMNLLEQRNPELFLKLLYAVVCIQSAYPRLYDELLKKPNLYEWIEDSGDTASVPDMAGVAQELEELHGADFVFENLLSDPWIRKRDKQIKALLLSIMHLVMEDKLARFKKDPSLYTTVQSLRTTKDYLDQIIRSSRLTFADIGEEEEENKEFSDIEEFVQYWAEQEIEESTLKNLEYFATRFNKVFADSLEAEYIDDRVYFNAVRDSGRRKIICSAQVHPNGLIIRAGKTFKMGITSTGFKNIRLNRQLDSVEKIQERDIDPMKARYKEFLGVAKVPNRWTKVNSLEEEVAAAYQESDSVIEEGVNEVKEEA